jgi:ribose 1,5-bisphosphokinase
MMSSAAAIGPGTLVLVVGPSGGGKDTLIGLVKGTCGGNDRYVFPRRAVTRASSVSEDNLAMTPAEFAAGVANSAFALHWRAHGLSYGIPRSIDDDIRLGRTVIVNVSRTIVAEARSAYRHVLVVLVTAPADVLARRLAARGRASDANIGERLQRASLDTEVEADVVIETVGPAEANARRLLEAIG